MASVILSDKLLIGVQRLLDDVRKEMIRRCATHYKFSEEEAVETLMVRTMRGERGSKVEKSKVPLPFVGVVEDCCHGLKQNHGLLTQCQKARSFGDYCTGCQKQADKNSSGKPNTGCIEDRMAAYECGKEYRDPKGKTPVCYAKVMQKLKLTEEEVKSEAKRQNVELPDDIFNGPTSKRGRPKKQVEKEASSGAKQRGRPKKKPVEVTTTEDLFASLISEAKSSPRPEPKKEKATPQENTNDDTVLSVKRFEFNGKKYLRTADNVLYDEATQECVGVFNEAKQEIEECDEEEEDDE